MIKLRLQISFLIGLLCCITVSAQTIYPLQIDTIRENYIVAQNAEITLEANPDDITEEILKGWKAIGINRLSIGIQSFFEEDLQWMNRAHTAQQAIGNLQLARQLYLLSIAPIPFHYPAAGYRGTLLQKDGRYFPARIKCVPAIVPPVQNPSADP